MSLCQLCLHQSTLRQLSTFPLIITLLSRISAALFILLPIAATSAEATVEDRVSSLESHINDSIDVSGALRYQYALRDFSDGSKDRGGDFEFDTFILGVDDEYQGLIFSMEYRFYRTWNAIKRGTVGYNFTDNTQGRLGLDRVPFGIMPFASHSFFFSSNYYLGLEDNYKAGITLDHQVDDWFVQGGFYKNAGFGAGGGNSSDPGRYSYDLVTEEDCAAGFVGQCNEEINQFNLRIARNVGETEWGISGLRGELFNQSTERSGDYWAAAAHVNAQINNWNLMAQATKYDYSPENPTGVSNQTVQVGAYDFLDQISAAATTYLVQVAYSQDVDMGPTSNILWYLNSNLVTDKSDDSEDTQMYIAGAAVSTGHLYTMIDLIMAKNQPFIGDSMVSTGRDWNTRFNIDFGYYF